MQYTAWLANFKLRRNSSNIVSKVLHKIVWKIFCSCMLRRSCNSTASNISKNRYRCGYCPESFLYLKEIRNHILRILCVCGHYFFNTGLPKFAFFTYYLEKIVFRRSVFDTFSLCSEIWIRSHICIIHYSSYRIIVYISVIWPSVILFSIQQQNKK